jgi:hypothetical protein
VKDQGVVLKDLKHALDVPSGAAELNSWLDHESSLGFIGRNAHADSLIINLSVDHLYLVSALIPRRHIKADGNNDLLNWNYDPSSSWSICASSEDAWVEEPIAKGESKSLEGGEPIVIHRHFEGVPEYSNYFELSQKLAHLMGLHFIPERRAWCRLDPNGDIEDVVRIVEIPPKGDGYPGRVILCDRATLAKYAELTASVFVQLFDITYVQLGNFTGWHHDTYKEREFGSIRYRYGTGSYAAFARGFNVVPLTASRHDIVNEMWGRRDAKKYETFITVDRKHGDQVIETSCDPELVDSYFRETGKPWQISPVFFRPEVLTKYKADREKYRLSHRTISCRGSWSIQTFDINEEGQVHTYLKYLSDLPHSEQLHWKQYNEEPKGPISARAHQTDIVGDFWDGYDPLGSLQYKLGHLAKAKCPWWSLRNDDLVEKVYYSVTTSPDEWADELLNLSQLVVEGFDAKYLRAKSGEADPKLQSLSLLEKCLVKMGFEDMHANTVVQPFRDLQTLRSKTKGHAGGSEAKALRTAAMKTYGSLQAHFRDLVARCDESIDTIMKAFDHA